MAKRLEPVLSKGGRYSRRGFLGCSAGAAGLFGASARGQESAAGPVFSRSLPQLPEHDVLVCGGGPSGIAAALAARREGLSVLLIDKNGQLGGTGTSGLVSHWLGGRVDGGARWAVGGIFRALSEEAASKGIALIPTPAPDKQYQPHGWLQGQLAVGIPFDPYRMAGFLDEKLTGTGVEVLLDTYAVETEVEGNRIKQVVAANKAGLSAIPAKVVVDATGDADIAARSGCPVLKGREEDGLMTPVSLTFHVDNVDQEALSAYIHEHERPRFREEIKALRAAGEWPFPYEIFISVQLEQPGTMMINTTRLVGIDGTDPVSLTEGLMRGRKEIDTLMGILRKHFPGFEQVRLKAVAPALGVRETRRIQAGYVLTVDDLRENRLFDDTIGFSSYGWDLPDPKKPSANPGHGEKPEVTPIPYRVMTPDKMANLICPGRAISVERPVLGPLRVMAPCMAMGEAAGTAAALAVQGGISFKEVPAEGLRQKLTDAGAIVTWA